jgi:FtsH-binding integral membrane protein
MPRSDEIRKHRWALLMVGLGFLLAAFLCYSSYAPTDSFFHTSDSLPGWVAVVVFIVIGVVVRLVRASYHKYDAENAKRNAQRIDLTKR